MMMTAVAQLRFSSRHRVLVLALPAARDDDDEEEMADDSVVEGWPAEIFLLYQSKASK
jgi:hypothetical protein